MAARCESCNGGPCKALEAANSLNGLEPKDQRPLATFITVSVRTGSMRGCEQPDVVLDITKPYLSSTSSKP